MPRCEYLSNMPIRCIAIDDEPLALRQLSSYIEKTPFLQLVAACCSALDAGERLREQEADLLFVDINMPDLNGIDFVRGLSPRPMVIFTTAYSEYAIEGYRVDAIDYLLKPISYAAFLHSAEKARRQYQLMQAAAERPAATSIFVRSEYKTLQIDIERILYVESRSEYVRIVTDSGRPVMTLSSLRSYEEKLPADRFLRIHRSYIVNLSRIVAVERKHVVLPQDHVLPIGELYEERFRRYLRSRSLD